MAEMLLEGHLQIGVSAAMVSGQNPQIVSDGAILPDAATSFAPAIYERRAVDVRPATDLRGGA
jgi:hypothetical protein